MIVPTRANKFPAKTNTQTHTKKHNIKIEMDKEYSKVVAAASTEPVRIYTFRFVIVSCEAVGITNTLRALRRSHASNQNKNNAKGKHEVKAASMRKNRNANKLRL